MDETSYASTAQVAAALGVSATTVKRWVDKGVLPAHRTPGGHRKLPLIELLRAVREGNFPRADLSRLGGTSTPQPPANVAPFAARFLTALLRGRDLTETHLVLQAARHAGLGMDRIADEVVQPAMARLGHEWERGTLEVHDEHRGTQLVLAALGALKTGLAEAAGSRRPLALGGAPAHDPYLLPSLLAEMVLLEAGWDVVNLGPDTPLGSFGRALEELRPRLLWLSVSTLPDPATFARDHAELYREAVARGIAVAIGGRALTEAARAALPYSTHGDRLAHLAAFARALHPRPQRGKRGRPPKR